MPKTTKEIGQDYLLFPDENPKYKYNKKWYSEEEYKSLFLDFQKAIDFINKKNLVKELAEFIKKGDD